ncbi:hypothetical protein BMETH_1587557641408, partial [methanotrophic bacterial endosymbiont of Bathymodiolus sp.]
IFNKRSSQATGYYDSVIFQSSVNSITD